MNSIVVVAELERAREAVLRALQRAMALSAVVGLQGCDALAADLREALHRIDRAADELRFG